jgi:transposase
MENLLFTGIDVSKDSFDISIIDSKNQALLQNKFDMNAKGFKDLSDAIKKLQTHNIYFLMESTSIYHLNLYFYLTDQNFKVAIVNPFLIHNFAKSVSLRKTKTDKIDANTISLFTAANYRNIDFSTKNYNSIRSIERERDALSQNLAKLKTEIKNILQIIFPELCSHYNVFTKTMLNLMAKAPGKSQIQKMKPQQIARIFNKTKGNKVKIIPAELIKLAKNSIGMEDESLEKLLTIKIERLIFIMGQINSMNKHIKQFVTEHLQQNFDIVTSIKGIGDITAAKFLIEIGDIQNFKSHKQLRAYIGTDPSVKQSGSSVNVNGKISKRGNAHLRKTVWQMAVGVIRSSDYFAQYFYKKINEGKKYKQAVIAVANKLIKTLYAMLKNKTSFLDNFAYQKNVIYS